MTPQEYKQHPLSAAFPELAGLDLQNLADDIRENGQREAGTIYEGMVLDGWHRYLACKEAGVAFLANQFPEEADPVKFVLSRNLHRRHLTASQRAASIVACTSWRPNGRQKNSAAAAELSSKQLAEKAKVSPRTIEHAKAAERAGLGEAVRHGAISAERGAELAKLPPKQREKAIKHPPAAKPKKSSPEEETIAALRAEITELKEALGEATVMAEAAKIHEGEEGFRTIKSTLAELESVKRERNRYMNELAEAKKQIKYLQSKLDKAGKK